MPYIGKSSAKLYQFIEIPDDATVAEKQLLQALITYRSAWAGVKQKKSFWDKTKDKDYFESTLLKYLDDSSTAENWGLSREEITSYLFKQKLLTPFKSDEAIKAYLKKIKKTDNQSQLDFYFLMQKTPDFIDDLEQAATESSLALSRKQDEIRDIFGDKTYLLAAIPAHLIDHQITGRSQRIDSIKGNVSFWLSSEPVSEEEIKNTAELLKPSEVITIIKGRQKKGLTPLPFLEDRQYVAWFARKLAVCGIRDETFSKGYLEVLKTAERHVLNGGRVTFELQCLFDNNDWFSALKQYKQTHEMPLEDMSDLGRELLRVLSAMFQLLLNIVAILATIIAAIAIEAMIITAFALFFEPNTFMAVFALSQSLPGGMTMIPLIVGMGLGLMVSTAAAVTGIVSNLFYETPGLSAEAGEAVSRFGERVYASLAILFNQGISHAAKERPATDDLAVEEAFDSTGLSKKLT